MPHHFKWINRATLLFNLASAELVGGLVGVSGAGGVRGRGMIRSALACLSLSWTDRLLDRQMCSMLCDGAQEN